MLMVTDDDRSCVQMDWYPCGIPFAAVLYGFIAYGVWIGLVRHAV